MSAAMLPLLQRHSQIKAAETSEDLIGDAVLAQMAAAGYGEEAQAEVRGVAGQHWLSRPAVLPCGSTSGGCSIAQAQSVVEMELRQGQRGSDAGPTVTDTTSATIADVVDAERAAASSRPKRSQIDRVSGGPADEVSAASQLPTNAEILSGYAYADERGWYSGSGADGLTLLEGPFGKVWALQPGGQRVELQTGAAWKVRVVPARQALASMRTDVDRLQQKQIERPDNWS